MINFMKAQKYVHGCMTFPCYAQPKINGGRSALYSHNDSFSNRLTLQSKEGHYYAINHLLKKAEPIFYTKVSHGSDYLSRSEMVLDGELYCYGKKSTTICGAARNQSNPIHDKLSFIIFDIANEGLDQRDRISMLDMLAYKYSIKTLNCENHSTIDSDIYILETVTINTEEEAYEYSVKCLDAGFEGCILRDMNAHYKFCIKGQRSPHLRKIKRKLYGNFIIADIQAKPIDVDQPLFIMHNNTNDLMFESNPTGTHADNRKYLINKKDYIGKTATLSYYERTINDLPFHNNIDPSTIRDTINEVEIKEDNTNLLNEI